MVNKKGTSFAMRADGNFRSCIFASILSLDSLRQRILQPQKFVQQHRPLSTTRRHQPTIMDSKATQQQGDANQPAENKPLHKATDGIKKAFQAHSANPGPAIPKEFNVPEEGTKEERRAKAKEMNK
ncbi:hypothetical protein VTG60DRAFT_4765 [Thermothelomyces hinnuleus]